MNRRITSVHVLAISLGAILALAFATATAGAATINVEVKGDFSDTPGNGCALREAVRSANEGTSIGGCTAGSIGPDTIRVPAGKYPLTIQGEDNGTELGDLDVSDDVKIVGSGSGAVIDAGGAEGLNDRVFDLRLGDATLRNLTIENGRVSGDGAGILGAASVEITLDDIKLLNNDANGPSKSGGAINASGPLRISDSLISGNNAPFDGAIESTGGMAMIRTTVRDNNAAFGAGGVFIASPSLIAGSTFTGNQQIGETGSHQGGAITTTDDVDIRNVTIAGNSADQSGGGIAAVNNSDVSLTNVTVTDNTADANQDQTNPGDGGGLYSENGGEFLLRSTVVSGNHDLTPSGDGNINRNCAAQLTLAGNNLLGDTDGCATQKLLSTPSEIATATKPKFTALKLNGGPTATIGFAKSSPLRNKIKRTDCNDGGISKVPKIEFDQRGVPRPQNGRCDVGAYESATCLGSLVNRVGENSADKLSGTSKRDGALGLGGKDKIKGKGGNDGLCGAGGKDKLVGGPGKDKLSGGPGRDVTVGGPGNDKLVGGPGRDVCIGGPGKDKTVGCEKVR
ncbi:CSLREA domain-containing protein [soil metagenome]